MSNPDLINEISEKLHLDVMECSELIKKVAESHSEITTDNILEIASRYKFKKPVTAKGLWTIHQYEQCPRITNLAKLALKYVEFLPNAISLYNENKYLKPGFNEEWIDSESTRLLEESLDEMLVEPLFEKWEKTSSKCLEIIINDRHYSIPPEGKAEFKMSRVFDNILRIEKIRFVQEGLNPPEVFVRFLFFEPSVVEILKICDDGQVNFCIGENWSEMSKELLKLCALVNYRDLVRAPEVYFYFSGIRSPNRPRNYDPVRNPIQYIPRKRYIPISHSTCSDNDDYEYDDYPDDISRSPGSVVGHLRYLGELFEASWIKEEECRQYLGRDLPPGHTFVNPYFRGWDGSNIDKPFIPNKYIPEPKPITEIQYRSTFYSLNADRDIRNLVKYRKLDGSDLKKYLE